jgi:hypothetical protein
MISRPQIPPNHYGTRLSLCFILALVVGCFFLGYDGLAHREAHSVLGVQQASDRVSIYGLRQNQVEDIPEPDMKSQDVTFANADVPLPAGAQSVLKSPEPAHVAMKPATSAQKHMVSRVQVRLVKPARDYRPTRTARIRNRQDGRAAFAQGFFGSAPFGGF